MAIRRKGWLAVSFKIKIEKEQKQGGSLITREEGREVGSSASEGNHFGWIQAKKFQIAVFSDKNFLDKVCQSHIRNILDENAKKHIQNTNGQMLPTEQRYASPIVTKSQNCLKVASNMSQCCHNVANPVFLDQNYLFPFVTDCKGTLLPTHTPFTIFFGGKSTKYAK